MDLARARAAIGHFCVCIVASLSLALAACGQMPFPAPDAETEDANECDGGNCVALDPLGPLEPDDGGEFDAAEDASLTDASSGDAGLIVDASVDGGPTALPIPTCGNVNQRLHDDFGIIIRPGTLYFEGLATEDIGCADRIKVYQMFRLPFEYTRYPVRLNPADPFTMHLYRSTSPASGSCSAYVPNAHAIQIRDLSQCLRVVSGTTDPDFIRIAMFLIHESGHIITARNSSLRTAFQNANLPAADPRCYDRGFLETYSLRTTNPVSESFAEATALFIGRRKVGPLGTITDFPTECPHTYDWIRTNVFGTHL